MRKLCPFFSLLLSKVLKVLTGIIKQDKYKRYINRKGEVKLPLFSDSMILYLKDLTDYMRKLLDLINRFSKVSECEVNT